VPQDFKRFVDHVISEGSNTTEDSGIKAIMEEVAKCGASEMSDEYYMATNLAGHKRPNPKKLGPNPKKP
jgi:hypothetical protein